MAFADAFELPGIWRAKDIGKKGFYQYQLVPCIDCGLERWVALKHGKPRSLRCYSCSNKIGRDNPMEKNGNWRGGRKRQQDGYITRTIEQDHPFRCMVDKIGRIREHRLVMAEHLGRPLATEEFVHHLNGVRTDNRIENLSLTDNKKHERHTLEHKLQKRIRVLEDKIAGLTSRLSKYEEVG